MARRRLANPERFDSPTIARCCHAMGDLIPRQVYDVCWGIIANDFGVFQPDAEVVRVEGFKRVLDLAPARKIARALELLEKEGQWLTWKDRRSGLKWAIFPRWGDEQTIGNPSLSREPVPPRRTLARCSLKTREFFARYSGMLRESLSCYSLPQEGGGGRGQEGGEGVQGEGADLPPEWADILQQLYSVPGYHPDRQEDIGLLERAVGLYGRELVTHVVAAWVTRRLDDPLKPGSRPRSELWNWFRKQKQWDDEDERKRQGKPKQGAARGWRPG